MEKEEDILWIYDYENEWYILPLLDLDTIERTLLDGEIVTCTTTSIQVYHEKYCPEGKLYFQKSISDDGIGASIYYGFGEWVVNEYKNLIWKKNSQKDWCSIKKVILLRPLIMFYTQQQYFQ